MAMVIIPAILIFISLSLPVVRAQTVSDVYVIDVNGDIGAGTADFIVRSIDKAKQDNATLLIKLNTTKGLLTSTGRIVDRMLQENSGVVVWVTPQDAKAFSAGAFVLLSANVAVMDTGTWVGMAEPKTEDTNVTVTLTQWIGQIATYRSRNVNVFQEFVAGNLILTDNALHENVVDYVTSDNENLMDYLGLESVKISQLERGTVDVFFDLISNPQLVMLLLVFGVFAILTEISVPGVGIPGIIGIVCMLLFFFGLNYLQVDYAGLGLMALGLVMLGYEIFSPRHGVFGGGGFAAIIIGTIIVGKEPWMEVASNPFKVFLVGVIVILSILLVVLRRSLKRPESIADKELLGELVVAVTDLNPHGMVKLKRKFWTAVCEEGAVKGEELVVKGVKGNVLKVEKQKAVDPHKSPE
jgi:membrane-bound serine protease (ClpP class)